MQEIVTEGDRDCQVLDYSYDNEVFSQQIIGYSEKLLESYLENEPISEEDLFAALRFRVQKGKIYPVYAGAALRDIGVTELMKGIVSWLPVHEQSPGISKPLSAYVYKVEFDEKGRKKAYFRIFTGKISMKDRIAIAEDEKEFMINNLATVIDGKQVKVSELRENDIGILMDVPELRCGDFLGKRWKQKGLITWGEPMLRVEVHPLVAAERLRLWDALKELEQEDPLLRINIDHETQEIQVSLFGKLQIEILEALLRDRFHIAVAFSGTKTICKGKPILSVDTQIRMYRDGNIHHAGIAFRVEPLATGMGNQYESKVSFGYLQTPFQNAVRDGVEKALENGLGDSIVDTKVTFISAEYDSVNSTPADYRRLAPLVIRKALLLSGICKLEPIMTYQLFAPIFYEKKIMGELRKMCASIENVTFSENEMTVKGLTPYDTAKEFQINLGTMTGGRGIFEMEFHEYRNIEERIKSSLGTPVYLKYQ